MTEFISVTLSPIEISLLFQLDNLFFIEDMTGFQDSSLLGFDPTRIPRNLKE